MLSVDELMETNTYQKFNKLIESVFETIEDDVIVTDEMGKSRIISQINNVLVFSFKDMYHQFSYWPSNRDSQYDDLTIIGFAEYQNYLLPFLLI